MSACQVASPSRILTGHTHTCDGHHIGGQSTAEGPCHWCSGCGRWFWPALGEQVVQAEPDLEPDPELDHQMVALEGSGWAVVDWEGRVLAGRWATSDAALVHGLAGKYLLSGADTQWVES